MDLVGQSHQILFVHHAVEGEELPSRLVGGVDPWLMKMTRTPWYCNTSTIFNASATLRG